MAGVFQPNVFQHGVFQMDLQTTVPIVYGTCYLLVSEASCHLIVTESPCHLVAGGGTAVLEE